MVPVRLARRKLRSPSQSSIPGAQPTRRDDMSFVRTSDGTRLYVKDWGQGRPVILLHTWPLNADCFDEISYALALDGYRVVAFDRRGFGRSSQPWDGYDYDTLSDDLATVIQTLDLRSVALVGYSMGGGEVARYMRRHRSREIDRVVFVSSQVFGLRRSLTNPAGIDPAQLEQLKAALIRERARFFSEFFLPNFYNADFLASTVSQEVVDWSCQMAMQASVRALVETTDSWGLTEFEADVRSISVPALVIHGTGDKMVPIEGSGVRRSIPITGARISEYAGAPHGIVASHPDRLIDDLRSFLSG